MYTTLVCMVMIQIPLGYSLPQYAVFGITGIWIAVIAGIISQTVLLTMMYQRGNGKCIAL
jgi:Na+-driven multidrug efflux pump